MDLGRFVLDKQILDSNLRRCGKVDDLVLVAEDGKPPRVTGILTQQGALARDMGRNVHRVVKLIYRLLGISQPQPVFIDWRLVTKIDVVVHLAVPREELGLDQIQRALARRIIDRIPGS